MIKTLEKQNERDNKREKSPKTAQEVLPIHTAYDDGIFLLGKQKYAQTWRFTDINYAIASREDKESFFLRYSDILNSCDIGTVTKLTIILRRMNSLDIENGILIPYQNDDLDEYRREYNDFLLQKAEDANCMVRELYITVTADKESLDEARTYFARVGTELTANFARLDAKVVPVNGEEKLRLLHDFFRPGEDFAVPADPRDIAPASFQFTKDHFKMGNRFGRALFLKDYAAYLKDRFLADLTDRGCNLVLSIDIIPVPTDEAVKEVEKRRLGIETNIANYQRKQNIANNFSAVLPYEMELQRQEAKEFQDDLLNRDQRMFFSNVTLMHTADSLSELNNDTEGILATGRKHTCQLAPLKFQQMDGLLTALPIGVRYLTALRTLTTESLAVLMPFWVQEIQDSGGVYFGDNAISRNLILCNKAKLQNPNAFLLGIPGSGKSFSAKELIVFLALATQDDILVCDPEREYAALIEAMGGEVIRIAAGSKDHINALDMADGYSDGDPIAEKSEFILSLFEQLDDAGITGKQRSLLDRCLSDVYTKFKRKKRQPTLKDLRAELLAQPEPDAHELALSLELFTNGSLDVFAHETNVDTKNRMIVYDIFGLGKQLKAMGLLVVTDAILNRVTENWRQGKRTHIFIDEFHVLFENEHSGEFFNSAWRQFRKRNAFPTAITQNVEYLLDSVLASTMLSNSEFIVMLNQAASDRENLAKLLNISPEQMSYITNAEPGHGLIRYGRALVPFKNEFPRGRLYDLMSTKPGD
ncbi:MAG: ATP-binding protein [Oscillospiraceae bacterium]|nr:ATP-binding protein [Oscillospiraceae bacterium]